MMMRWALYCLPQQISQYDDVPVTCRHLIFAWQLMTEVAKAMVGGKHLSEEKKGYLYDMTGEAKSKANSREGSKANSKANSREGSKANSKANSREGSKANSREGSKANNIREGSKDRSPIATPRTPRSARGSKGAASASGGSESGSGAFNASGKRKWHRGVPNDTSHDVRNQPSSVEDAEKVEMTGPVSKNTPPRHLHFDQHSYTPDLKINLGR